MNSLLPNPLRGVVVAIPETRQRDILATLLKRRGAEVLEVPLVAIHDNPDLGQVLPWLDVFVTNPPDMFILLTGEGLRRLWAVAGRHGIETQFLDCLSKTITLCRGPKPEQVLRELSLVPGLRALEPTTAGIIRTLADHKLKGLRVGVQLYGQEPNLPLVKFLQEAGATVEPVAPYIYASKEQEGRVADFIMDLAKGKVDVLAFTSQSQFKRLQDVARSNKLESTLHQGMSSVTLAAVGPVVRQQLQEAGYKVEIMPERVYFMKPLVAAIERYFL